MSPDVVSPQAVAAASAAAAPERAGDHHALLQRSDAACRAGDHLQGADLARAALERAEAAGDAEAAAAAMLLLCRHETRLARSEAAIEHGQDAARRYEALGASGPLTDALTCVAYAYCSIGLTVEGYAAATRALDLARALGDEGRLFWAQCRLGRVLGEMGELIEAVGYEQMALDTARRTGDAEALFAATNNLASTNADRAAELEADGDAEAAREAWQRAVELNAEAVRLAEASGNKHRLAIAVGNRSNALAALGRYDDARTTNERARRLAVEGQFADLVDSAVVSDAVIGFLQGDAAAAIAHLEPLVAAGRPGEDLGDAYELLVRACKATGDYRSALEYRERLDTIQRRTRSYAAAVRKRLATGLVELESARAEAALHRARAEQMHVEKVALEAHARELGLRAHTDTLTGLWNRRYVAEQLPLMLAQATPSAPPCVLLLDLDHFKQVNDTHGHAMGDEVLQAVAAILRTSCRPDDLVARYGGEEFVVLVARAATADAWHLAERLRRAVAAHDWQGLLGEMKLTVSVGLAARQPGENTSALLGRADRHLYDAKHEGRNRVEPVFDEFAAPGEGLSA